MSDGLSKLSIEDLVDAADELGQAYGRHKLTHEQWRAEYDSLAAEARRRDAQRAQWPSGDVAAEQLADAMLRANVYPATQERAAAVLARLQTGAKGVG